MCVYAVRFTLNCLLRPCEGQMVSFQLQRFPGCTAVSCDNSELFSKWFPSRWWGKADTGTSLTAHRLHRLTCASAQANKDLSTPSQGAKPPPGRLLGRGVEPPVFRCQRSWWSLVVGPTPCPSTWSSLRTLESMTRTFQQLNTLVFSNGGG